MRGRNVFVKIGRNIRARNLVWKRREVSSAEAEKYLIERGYKKDTPFSDNWFAARKRAVNGRKRLAKERKKIRERQEASKK